LIGARTADHLLPDQPSERESDGQIDREGERERKRGRERGRKRDVFIMFYLNVLFCMAKAMASLATNLR